LTKFFPPQPKSRWDFGEFLHGYAKIPTVGAPRGVCRVYFANKSQKYTILGYSTHKLPAQEVRLTVFEDQTNKSGMTISMYRFQAVKITIQQLK
jgi:hypothetical protein